MMIRGLVMAYGDIRVERRSEEIVEAITSKGTVVVRELGETRAGEKRIRNFLDSPHVDVDAISEDFAARTVAQCRNRDVLIIQDTTEINFDKRDKKRSGFGPGADGETPAYFIHAAIVVDRATEAVLGLLHAEIWTRSERLVRHRRKRDLEEKESARWLRVCEIAEESLAGVASSFTVIADRESDIYQLFARFLDGQGYGLIVRAGQNRALADGEGCLFEALDDTPSLGESVIDVGPRPGAKARKAKVELRAAPVRPRRPLHLTKKTDPDEVALWLVEAREINVPKGATPICWRLLTARPVASPAEAQEVVNRYRLRWRIEQVFRALKSDGMRLEDSQITEPGRMFNLAAMALGAAVRTIQLVDARDGGDRPMTDVLDERNLPMLEKLSHKLEGATERQQNPHKPGSLSFVAWIAGRLGGWNCYYKPPGPKTMHRGWDRLNAMIDGYDLATQRKNLGIP